MKAAFSLESLPLIIEQPPNTGLRELVLEIVLAGFGAGFVTLALIFPDRGAGYLPIGLLLIAGAAVHGYFCFRTLRRQERLIIDRDGLKHEGRVRVRSWKWSEIGDFRDGRDSVSFTASTHYNLAIDRVAPNLGGPWPMPPLALAILLNEAKRRFG